MYNITNVSLFTIVEEHIDAYSGTKTLENNEEQGAQSALCTIKQPTVDLRRGKGGGAR
jgi:hypothetical protein